MTDRSKIKIKSAIDRIRTVISQETTPDRLSKAQYQEVLEELLDYLGIELEAIKAEIREDKHE